jgi:hypothetical protein
MTERYLTAQQVCDRYGLSLNWLYHCHRLRKYARRAGRYLRYREADLELFELEGAEDAQFQRVMRHSAAKTIETDKSLDGEVEGHKGLSFNKTAFQCRIRSTLSYTYGQSRHNNNHLQKRIASEDRLRQTPAVSRTREIAYRLRTDPRFPAFWRARHLKVG